MLLLEAAAASFWTSTLTKHYNHLRDFLSDDELDQRVRKLSEALGFGSDPGEDLYGQLQRDVRLVSALENSELDLDKVWPIEQWVYFDDGQQAKRFARAVATQKNHRARRADFNGSSWPVVVRSRSNLQLETVARMTTTMKALAKQYGGDYDGFEATVQRSPECDLDSICGNVMTDDEVKSSGIALRQDTAQQALQTPAT